MRRGKEKTTDSIKQWEQINQTEKDGNQYILINCVMKKSSRNWSIDEDKMLSEVMLPANGSRKLKWQQVADIMHQKIQNCQKTGKQCRQRWHNHLAPQLNNSGEWTPSQNQILFKYHGQLGNKWAKIATYLKGRTDNCVKNHFYSTLRRGMRKVNNFIHEYRKKKNSIKQFKPDVLTKILIVADGDPQQKLNAKNNADSLSKKIKQLLIQVSLGEDEDIYDESILDKVIELIIQFNKNCKKRKGKKKGPSTDKFPLADKEEDQIQQDEISYQQKLQQSPKDASASIKQQAIQKTSKIGLKDIKQRNKEKQKQKNVVGTKAIKKEEKKEQQIQEKQKQITKTAITSEKQKQNEEEQEKDEVKSVEFQEVPPTINEKNTMFDRKRINRVGSIESFHSEFNNHNNFGNTSFYNPANYNNEEVPLVEKIFQGSGFQLLPEYQQNQNYKEMFADSNAEGIKKGQAAFFQLSGRSMVDQKSSFFAYLGDKGIIQPSQLIQSGSLDAKTSAIQGLKFKKDNQSPGLPFVNGGSAFSKPQFFKNFVQNNQAKDSSKLGKQDHLNAR